MRIALTLTIGLFIPIQILHAQDQAVESHVNRVGLFKNGIGLIERTVEVSGDGTYYLAPSPDPIHGTVWISSNAEVGVRRSTRSVALPRNQAMDPLYGPLVGKDVTVYLKNNFADAISGRLEALLPLSPQLQWGRNYTTDPYGRNYNLVNAARASYPLNLRMLVLRVDDQRLYLRPDAVQMISESVAEDVDASTVQEEVPVLEFSVNRAPDAGAEIVLTYLTRGLTWAPSYRLQLSGDDAFSLEQQALIINEREDLESVPIELITGFPAIALMQTGSPLGPQSNLTQFFQELAARPQNQNMGLSNSAIMTQRMYNAGGGGGFGGSSASPAIPPSALTSADADLHYLPIGEKTIKEGEVLSVSAGEEKGTYRNILQWTENSRQPASNYGGRQNTEEDPRLAYPGLWDALVLENPFDRPLTTAPCYMELDGRFLGQSILYWTATGNETTLPVTKALGVPTDAQEETIRTWRDEQTGRNFREIRVVMTLTNTRPEAQEVSVQYRMEATTVTVPEGEDTAARIIEITQGNDLYLVTSTLNVEPDQVGRFEFTYERLN